MKSIRMKSLYRFTILSWIRSCIVYLTPNRTHIPAKLHFCPYNFDPINHLANVELFTWPTEHIDISHHVTPILIVRMYIILTNRRHSDSKATVESRSTDFLTHVKCLNLLKILKVVR